MSGGVLKVLGIIFIVIIAIILIGGFLFYNFFSVHVASVCVYSEEQGMQTMFSCTSNTDCKASFYQNAGNASSLPDPLKNKIDIILDDVALCTDSLCEFKNFSIIKNKGLIKDNFGGEISLVENCDREGKEHNIKLKIKEIITFLKQTNTN
ncbi:MAG TPA: hypothetical protein VI815_01670 [Candidatus Nanoarchaeia archaeon]|nr:hypothetical protein [Candidatus Nanoarchaeia archaeon]